MLYEAERRYKDGKILRVIADDLGVSLQRLAVRLRERGVRQRGEKPSSEQVHEMCLRYEQDESLARVGERMGFNVSTVRVQLPRVGVALRSPHGRERSLACGRSGSVLGAVATEEEQPLNLSIEVCLPDGEQVLLDGTCRAVFGDVDVDSGVVKLLDDGDVIGVLEAESS